MSGTVAAPATFFGPPPASQPAQARRPSSQPPSPPASLDARIAARDAAAVRAVSDLPKMPAPPKTQPLPNAPAPYQGRPIDGLKNWGTVLAVFGSLLTRAPLTSAIKSAAASMTAWNAGQERDYKLNLARFQTDLKKAIAQNAQELSAYRAALAAGSLNVQEGLDQAKVTALVNHDEIGLATLRQNGFLGLQKLAVMRQEAAARLVGVEAQVRIGEENAQTNRMKAYATLIPTLLATGQPVPDQIWGALGLKAPGGSSDASAAAPGAGTIPAASGAAGVGPSSPAIKGAPVAPGVPPLAQPNQPKPTIASGALKGLSGVDPFGDVLHPDSIANLSPQMQHVIYQVATYSIAPPQAASSFGGGEANILYRQTILDGAKKLNPGFQALNYVALEKIADEAGSTSPNTLVGQVYSFDTAVAHASLLASSVKGLANSPVQLYNRVANWTKTQAGSAAMSAFRANALLMAQEMTKFLRGGGGTGAEVEQLNDLLSNAQSPAQILGVVGRITELALERFRYLLPRFEPAARINPSLAKIIPDLKAVSSIASLGRDYQNALTPEQYQAIGQITGLPVGSPATAPQGAGPNAALAKVPVSALSYLRAHVGADPSLLNAFAAKYGAAAANAAMGAR